MKSHRLLIYILVPMLVIGGYITMDHLVAPVAKDAPMAYRLMSEEGCHLGIEACVLRHESFTVRLSRDASASQDNDLHLNLEASEPLNGVAISLSDKKEAGQPENMLPSESDRQWTITLHEQNPQGVLRLLLLTGETSYFAELPVTL